jgi:lipoprotein-anchoring transpeptidase ErfK/SrfK
MQSDKKQRTDGAVEVDSSHRPKTTGRQKRVARTALKDAVSIDYKEHTLEKPRPSFFRRLIPDRLLIASLFLLVSVAGLGFVVLNYKPPASKTPKSFQIAGVNIINQDAVQAERTLDQMASAQKINIAINDKTYTYKAADLGIRRDFSSLIDADYSPPKSLLNKLTDKNTQPGLQTVVQKKQLISAIESKLGQYKSTVNASVDLSGGDLVVKPSKAGIGLNFDEIAKQLQATDLRHNQTVTVNFSQSQPEIPTKAAEAAKIQAETLIQPTYGISANGSPPRLASAAQKASWLIFAPDEQAHLINVSINIKAAQNTLTKIAQSYGQTLKNKITLTAMDGSVSVIDKGQPGISIDQTSLSDGLNQLETALNNNQPYTMAVTLTAQTQGERDLGTSTGGKFVLVDVADYRAYAIDNTTVNRTMVVSTGRPGLETPKGHFAIMSKTKLTTMHGCNVKVGCWTVPNVPNAEFFTKDGDALHGTYWYVNWGHQNASHGCVNLQLADASWLYGWTQVGTDVIVV